MRYRILLAIPTITTILLGTPTGVFADQVNGQSRVIIATGPVVGINHWAGGAICRLYNRARPTNTEECVPRPTGGSVYNLEALRKNRVSFAVVQGDVLLSDLRRSHDILGDLSAYDLRVVLRLHDEQITLLAPPDRTGFPTGQPPQRLRLGTGSKQSGHYATATRLAALWSAETGQPVDVVPLSQEGIRKALCNHQVDLAAFVVANPADLVESLIEACDAELVPIETPAIIRALALREHYRLSVIDGGAYDRAWGDVVTVSRQALLVASASAPAKDVDHLIRSVADNYTEFRNAHPALRNLRFSDLIPEVGIFPVHERAAAYFAERGLNNQSLPIEQCYRELRYNQISFRSTE